MKVIVKTAFTGAPDGQMYGRRFEVGDTVEGNLADVAVREGWAEVECSKVQTSEPTAAPKAKAKGRGKAAAAEPVPAKEASQDDLPI